MTAQTGIGARVKRKEDQRFLTGTGRYVDDLSLARTTHAYFVRSPHAHARIKSVDISAAKAMPGVVEIFTGKDVADAKVGSLICGWVVKDKHGEPHKSPPHPVLAHDVVRQHRVRRRLVRLAVLVLDHPAADQAADLGVGDVLAGEDLDDARHRLGGRDVDALDPGMGVRRAHEVGMRGPRERQVVDVAAGAGQEALVFLPLDPGANSGLRGHGYTPAAFMAGAAARIALTMLW